MKKIIGILLVAFLLSTTTAKAAPSWQVYASLLQSDDYLKLVSSQAKRYAREVVTNLPTPTTPQEIGIYNFAHSVLVAKYSSPTIYKIASFITNDNYLTNVTDWQSMGEDILNGLNGTCGSFTVFACIAGVY